MPIHLTIDGLPLSFTDENLKELFASYGPVLRAVMDDPHHIPTYRYGLVEMATVEGAGRARAALNRTTLNDQLILVFESLSQYGANSGLG
jgi:hypothetical protein